jgi:hypothetical protein
MKTLKAIEKIPSYENYEVSCPHCKHWNIYNRVSDIKSIKLITDHIVVCQNDKCKKEFCIGGDFINPAWQMLILDCEMLKESKRYSYCILNLCQAFEMYFSFYPRVELIYKPFAIEQKHDFKHFNKLSHLLMDNIKDLTYSPLRSIIMNLIIKNGKYKNLSESEVDINNLKSYKKTPSDIVLTKIAEKELSNLLIELKENSIHYLRNQVVHKEGYRPTLEEVERAEESSRILYKLDNYLGVLSQQSYYYENYLIVQPKLFNK